jgi:hypothetical protein
MARDEKKERPNVDLEAEALAALDHARAMPQGPERTEALKKAGILRNAADLQGIFLRSGDAQLKLKPGFKLPRNE